MKKSELKKYIKEEIVATLSEDSNALVTTKGGTKTVPFKSAAELDPLKKDPNVTGITTTAGQKLKEDELDEMANIAKGSALEKAIEKVVKANRATDKKELRKKIRAKVQALLNGEELYDTQLNKLIDKIRSGKAAKKTAAPKAPKATVAPTADEEGEAPEMDDSSYYKSEEEFSTTEKEPSKKELEKSGVVSLQNQLTKTNKELKDLTKEMKAMADKYKAAPEADKQELLRTLKSKTAAKKELEAKKSQIEDQLGLNIEDEEA